MALLQAFRQYFKHETTNALLLSASFAFITNFTSDLRNGLIRLDDGRNTELVDILASYLLGSAGLKLENPTGVEDLILEGNLFQRVFYVLKNISDIEELGFTLIYDADSYNPQCLIISKKVKGFLVSSRFLFSKTVPHDLEYDQTAVGTYVGINNELLHVVRQAIHVDPLQEL